MMISTAEYTGFCGVWVTFSLQTKNGGAFNIEIHTRVEFVDALLTNMELVHYMQECWSSVSQYATYFLCALCTVDSTKQYSGYKHKNNSRLLVYSILSN